MLHTLWSVKGGSGVSVTAAVLTDSFARRAGRAVLVDLAGDQPAVLGLASSAAPGVSDWLASTDAAEDALGRLLVEARPGRWLLPRGHATTWTTGRTSVLLGALAALRCPVVVDAGLLGASDDGGAWTAFGARLADAGRSWLVTRPCYLAMRRYHELQHSAAAWSPDGVVVLVDGDRALRPTDVATALRLPLVAAVDLDQNVARAVDAGTLLRRRQRTLERQLRRVA